MKAFIKRHEYNYIRKRLNDLNNAFLSCVDNNIIGVTKSLIQEKIRYLFTNLSENENELLDISKITNWSHIDRYLAELDEYVYGMPTITNAQINRLFKKEKKLKLPNPNAQNLKNVYLGWIDESSRKLFIAYIINEKLIGMTCRITDPGSNNTHRCVLCNRVGKESEVAFVTSICKTTHSADGTYRSIGFDICLDSARCNERISSIKKLEELLMDVNNIK
jgi:hypothetical protein